MEANKQVVRRFFKILSSADLEDLDAVVAMDYVNHNPVPGQTPGRRFQGLC